MVIKVWQYAPKLEKTEEKQNQGKKKEDMK